MTHSAPPNTHTLVPLALRCVGFGPLLVMASEEARCACEYFYPILPKKTSHHPPCKSMQLVQQLLQLLADGLVVVGKPDNCIPVDSYAMHVNICTREALQDKQLYPLFCCCACTSMLLRSGQHGCCDDVSCERSRFPAQHRTSLSIKLSCIPGCPGPFRRADRSLISASMADLCC